MLVDENSRQNLLSASTLPQIFARHIVDSAQLIPLAQRYGIDRGGWLDLGSGAGLPGLVVAMLVNDPVTLVESRRLRADWLLRAVESLRLCNVHVEACTVQAVSAPISRIITARAFAPLPKLFELAYRFSKEETLWLLPKGRSAAEELASVASTWHGNFDMVQSMTDPDSQIIVARDVRPKRGVRR